MRRWGEPPEDGRRYLPRPGAYAVLLRAGDILLTLQEDGGEGRPEVQLPGGGLDPGESPLRALHREVREETGWSLASPRRLLTYRRYRFMPEYGLWADKVCHLYLARPARPLGPPTEPGHQPLWAPLAAAPGLLANPAEAAAVAGLL